MTKSEIRKVDRLARASADPVVRFLAAEIVFLRGVLRDAASECRHNAALEKTGAREVSFSRDLGTMITISMNVDAPLLCPVFQLTSKEKKALRAAVIAGKSWTRTTKGRVVTYSEEATLQMFNAAGRP